MLIVLHEEADVVFERLWDSVVVAEFDNDAVAVVVGVNVEETVTVIDEVGEIEVDPLALTLADEQLDALGDDDSLGLPETVLEAKDETVRTADNDRVGDTVAVLQDVRDAEPDDVEDIVRDKEIVRVTETLYVADKVIEREDTRDCVAFVDGEDRADGDGETEAEADGVLV